MSEPKNKPLTRDLLRSGMAIARGSRLTRRSAAVANWSPHIRLDGKRTFNNWSGESKISSDQEYSVLNRPDYQGLFRSVPRVDS